MNVQNRSEVLHVRESSAVACWKHLIGKLYQKSSAKVSEHLCVYNNLGQYETRPETQRSPAHAASS